MKLKGSITDLYDISEKDKGAMFNLMNTFYDNMKFNIFLKDLQEKDWVLLLHDEFDEVKGFTTLKLITLDVGGKEVKGIFSGDTIIHKECWGDLELGKVWLKYVLSLAEKHKESEFYWFLISKGYKTYKMMQLYFKEFFPRYDAQTPKLEKNVIDAFGKYKYPYCYNKDLGIIFADKDHDRLKPGVGDIVEHKLRDPHINFFAQKNPGHVQGNELVCIAKISHDNLNQIAFKYLLQKAKI